MKIDRVWVAYIAVCWPDVLFVHVCAFCVDRFGDGRLNSYFGTQPQQKVNHTALFHHPAVLFHCLVGSLVGSLVGRLVGWLLAGAGWLAGLLVSCGW